MGGQHIVQLGQPQLLDKVQYLVAFVIFAGIDQQRILLGGDQDALALADVDDIDLQLAGGRQGWRGRGGAAVEDAVDKVHALLRKRGVDADHVAAKGDDAQDHRCCGKG